MALDAPEISDLYLAFRQAKSALFFEKRGVGLIELASYEENLDENLKDLRKRLVGGRWFDALSLGETWVVPKRFHSSTDAPDDVIRIGPTKEKETQRPIDVQLRVTPHPDFAIVEVLYLWRFGGALERLLSKSVLGYRLDLRNGSLSPHRRWLFEFWPKRYQQFRREPLRSAADSLGAGKKTLVVCGDLANFYDTIDPSFMMSDSFVAECIAAFRDESRVAEYRKATSSLIRAYARFREVASSRLALPVRIGIPIGALTSRLVANLALIPLDRHVESASGVVCYRRYVDDLVIVAEAKSEQRLQDEIRRFLPLSTTASADVPGVLMLDAESMGRSGSEFQLQQRKIRVHHLAGSPGSDFIDAVASDFAKTLSERRAFVDSSTLVGDGVSHLIRAGNLQGSPLRVLREADRARLERFSLSTSLRSLERASSLIDHSEAQALVRGCLDRVGRVLDAEDNWVDDLDVTIRLLKLAICTGDWESVEELLDRTDRIWGSVDALKARVGKLSFRGQEINPSRLGPWTWLRNYLHQRRLEAICACLPIGMHADAIATRFPGGLRLRTVLVKATVLRRKAELLSNADLRSRDREDDVLLGSVEVLDEKAWSEPNLSRDKELSDRLRAIEEFTKICRKLGDHSWDIPASRLFLCTRPPSYFDVARRCLFRVEETGFEADTFESLIRIVNAIRGTAYGDAVGHAVDRRTVYIDPPSPSTAVEGGVAPEPRVILGNLVVDDAAWIGAATRKEGSTVGEPVLTASRLKALNDVLEKAVSISRKGVLEMLVLPELSLPRRWFRSVANHVVRIGSFGLVAGLEYVHHRHYPFVSNQVYAVIPGPFMSVAVWPWTKRLPAREEAKQLSRLPKPVSFSPRKNSDVPRAVIHSAWGRFSVLICSELIEARRVADLLGRVELILCPAWNPDTSSYDHLIQSVGFQLHSVIAVANNGHYSDCRAWAPRSKRWERDLCRLIERDVNDVVHFDLPLASLSEFHFGDNPVVDRFAELRALVDRRDFSGAKRALAKIAEEAPGDWRPLPPDWR